jgi:hypothetical protein
MVRSQESILFSFQKTRRATTTSEKDEKWKQKENICLMEDVTIELADYVPDHPTDGLVALYRFSGNARDSSGNGYHGTLNGAADVSTGELYVDAADDYAILPAEVINWCGASQEFTIAWWCLIETVNTGSGLYNTLFAASTSGVDNYYALPFYRNSNEWQLFLDGAYPGSGCDWPDSNLHLAWRFYLFERYESTGVWRTSLMKNNVTLSTPENQNKDLTGVDRFIVGQLEGGAQTKNWRGWIDNFMIYDRRLTTDEKTLLYSLGRF